MRFRSATIRSSQTSHSVKTRQRLSMAERTVGAADRQSSGPLVTQSRPPLPTLHPKVKFAAREYQSGDQLAED
jgi:hypothetical protein